MIFGSVLRLSSTEVSVESLRHNAYVTLIPKQYTTAEQARELNSCWLRLPHTNIVNPTSRTVSSQNSAAVLKVNGSRICFRPLCRVSPVTEVDVTMELRDTVQQLFDMTTRKDFN